jgi:Raf kinase inhibitor-like YbhB/YbcL family protein
LPPQAPPGVTAVSLTVTSKGVPPNGAIPVDYTCDGKNVNPQLTWSAAPEGTQSIAVVVDDPDASSGLFTHWILFNVGAAATSLAEAVDPASLNARQGLNGFGNPRYEGPCPPKGELHRYRFLVYALNATLDAPEGATRADVDGKMNGHVLGEGVLYGVFSH